MRSLAPRSSRAQAHPGRQWTPADALRVFAIRGEMRWCGKARLRLEHNLRHPDMTLSINGKVFKEFRAVCPKTRRPPAGARR